MLDGVESVIVDLSGRIFLSGVVASRILLSGFIASGIGASGIVASGIVDVSRDNGLVDLLGLFLLKDGPK